MRILLILLLSQPLHAALSVSVGSTQKTQTQAVMTITGASGPCTLKLSEAPGYLPPHPDVSAVEYANSNIDGSRSDTITWGDGTRLVTLGHQNADRALATDTTYYWEVSICGTTQTGSFKTPTLSLGSTQTWPVPFDASKWGNRDLPQTLDALLSKAVLVDPQTGVKMHLGSGPLDWTATYPGGSTNPVQTASLTFPFVAGGTGWTNPTTITAGASSTATTTNTNPIDLYPGSESAGDDGFGFDGFIGYAWNDLGAVLTASGPQFGICLILNPVDGCLDSLVPITPTGSFAPLASLSNDPNHPYPASFPKAFFDGWGANSMIRAEDRPTSGTLNAVAGALNITGYTVNGSLQAGFNRFNHFQSTLKAGNKVYIAGSSPTCTNNLCTFATVKDAAHATISENLTITGATYVSLRAGIRIQKIGGGTLRVGATYKIGGNNFNGSASAISVICNANLVTTGHSPAKTVQLCVVSGPAAGKAMMYAYATDGSYFPLWTGKIPFDSYFTGTLHFASTDIPFHNRPNVQLALAQPDSHDGRTWYALETSNDNSTQILYKLHYDGDFTESRDYGYTQNTQGTAPILIAPSDNWTWSLVNGYAHTIAAQMVLPQFSYFESGLYGAGGLTLVGVSGTTAYLIRNYNGSQDRPAWLLHVDISSSPGVLTALYHTLDGNGLPNAEIRFGGFHHGAAVQMIDDAFSMNTNFVRYNDTSWMFSGPFQMPITGIKSWGGAYKSDTCLDFPYHTGTACADENYDNTCPAGVTGECVTLRVPSGGWCNVAASSTEKLHTGWACPNPASAISGWVNANYSQPVKVRKGDVLMDYINGNPDREPMTVVADPVTLGDGQWSITVQRNSHTFYSCSATLDPVNCVEADADLRHANGWTATANASHVQGQSGDAFVMRGKATPTVSEVPTKLQGHGELVPGFTTGKVAQITTASGAEWNVGNLYDTSVPISTLAAPKFASTSLSIGGGNIQAYVSAGGAKWFIDSNTINNNGGCCEEAPGDMGPRTLTATATADVYRIGVMGTVNYKVFPLLGWAGRYLLIDKSSAELPGSGPSAGLTTSWSMCHALHAGECYAASAAGQTFVHVPVATDYGACIANQTWANAPCVLTSAPGAGLHRQQEWITDDTTSAKSRVLTGALTIPGGAYAYAGTQLIGTSMAWISPNFVLGYAPLDWIAELPSFKEGTTPLLNDVVSVPITVASGALYAEVEFGYSRYGSSLHCTPRLESCNTSGTPYSFASEAKTLTSCASGCTINVPAQGPNMMMYRINRSADGVTWSNGDIHAIAVTGTASSACDTLVTSPTSLSIVAAGASGTLAVTADSGCTWSASSPDSWLTITGGATGNGTINYTAAANAGPARSSTIAVVDYSVPVMQAAAAACSYSISPSANTFVAGGGSVSVAVTTGGGCAWTASSGAWSSSSPASGTGSGTVTVTAAFNAGSTRNESLMIAGSSFAATQSGTGPSTGTGVGGKIAVTGTATVH